MGFANALGRGLAAVGDVGVMLKSKRDYDQNVEKHATDQALAGERITAAKQSNLEAPVRFQQDQDSNAERLSQACQGTATGADAAIERARARTWQADDRAFAEDYFRPFAPQPASFEPQQAVPALVAPPASAQPMPASALSGVTLSSSPPDAPPIPPPAPQAPVAEQSYVSDTTPLSMKAPPSQVEAPSPRAEVSGGRVGYLEGLAERRYKRGDKAGGDAAMKEKAAFTKEGFGEAAREAMMDPKNVRGIERAFNEVGSSRMVPGSLTYKGKGIYSGSWLDKDGTARPFNDFNMMGAAMALGVVPGPKMIGKKADENIFVQNPDGKVTQVGEAQKFVTTVTANGDVVTTNATTGDVKVTKVDGTEGRVTPNERIAMSEIMSLVGREAKNRVDTQFGSNKKPLLNESVTAGNAISIFRSNPNISGLTGPKASEIALAIHDKDPAAVTGTAMRDDELWNVVRYGKGKDLATYGISRTSKEAPDAKAAPAGPAPAPAAVAPKPPVIAAPRPQAAPIAPPIAPPDGGFARPPAPAARNAALDAKVQELAVALPAQSTGMEYGNARVGQYKAVLVAQGAAKALASGKADAFSVKPMDMLAKVPDAELRLALSSPELDQVAKQMIVGYLMSKGR